MSSNRSSLSLLLLSFFFGASVFAEKSDRTPKKPSIAALEQRLSAIDYELEQLAPYNLRMGTGAIGFRSAEFPTPPKQTLWVEVKLQQEVPIDEVVLIPALLHFDKGGFEPDAFPAAFRIIAGSSDDPVGSVVAAFDSTDHLLPRIAPLVIPLDGFSASWVRIEATQLVPRAGNGRYCFQLSELLIFSEGINVALHQSVTYDPEVKIKEAWQPAYLVDGFMPYLMDSAEGPSSSAFVSRISENKVLELDLKKSHPVSRIHLHPADQGKSIPLEFRGDLGIPNLLKIEGANRPDFSDAVPLLEEHYNNLFDVGPILMRDIPVTRCRYIRISGSNSIDNPSGVLYRKHYRIGFAEIEIFASGENVALNSIVPSLDPSQALYNERIRALTDGSNLYGTILSIRDWMRQLARRHDLENERPKVSKELTKLYVQQKLHLTQMKWLAVLLVAATVIILLTEKVFRQRAVYQTRERIAANLHDELGANLSAIALLGDFAKALVEEKNAQQEWQELSDVITEVRNLTEETGITARHCTNLLEATGHYENLVEDIKRSAQRLLADIDHQFTFENIQLLEKLSPRRRIDLTLFYKECLNNIIRHSKATEVSSQIIGSGNKIRLIIEDNGQGLHNAQAKPKVPTSIRRRARMAGGKVTVATPPEGGTRIMLKIRLRLKSRFSKKSLSKPTASGNES